MTFNFDFLAAGGALFGAPPLVGASLAVAAMLFLWLSSKLLKFAQIGLGATAVFFLVRFALAGGVVTPEPVQAAGTVRTAASAASTPAAIEAAPGVVSTPTSPLGAATLPGVSEVHIDSTGFTVHVPFAGLGSVQSMLEKNQTEVQRALAPVTPTEIPGPNPAHPDANPT